MIFHCVQGFEYVLVIYVLIYYRRTLLDELGYCRDCECGAHCKTVNVLFCFVVGCFVEGSDR